MAAMTRLDAAKRAILDAEAKERAAQGALAAERKRLEDTQAEIDAISEQVGATDPDDSKAFEQLVRKRDAARGRLEALKVREHKRAIELDTAGAHVQDAKAEARQAQDAELAEKIEALDLRITAQVKAFCGEVVPKIRELQTLMRDRAGNPNATFPGAGWAEVRIGGRFEQDVAALALRDIGAVVGAGVRSIS